MFLPLDCVQTRWVVFLLGSTLWLRSGSLVTYRLIQPSVPCFLSLASVVLVALTEVPYEPFCLATPRLLTAPCCWLFPRS